MVGSLRLKPNQDDLLTKVSFDFYEYMERFLNFYEGYKKNIHLKIPLLI